MNPIPDTVQHYLGNYAPKGELLGYWIDKRGEYFVLVAYSRDGHIRYDVGSFPQIVGHWGHQLTGGDYDINGIQNQLAYGLWDAPDEIKQRLRDRLASDHKT